MKIRIRFIGNRSLRIKNIYIFSCTWSIFLISSINLQCHRFSYLQNRLQNIKNYSIRKNFLNLNFETMLGRMRFCRNLYFLFLFFFFFLDYISCFCSRIQMQQNRKTGNRQRDEF